ncbi:hypothetical protein BC6307_20395 [Sutcliffiella cohnii]|uniref:Uncharacterized protein n=1 Tax=Sutcliffiella cohnii TaxID=33932 RepID=A0A223KVT9_9BACI|nr:DUF5381 family protein [Sutcliffiella cohnii]AST93458.1 hypothetical protein BC6307_20395 [Sutcliffiella cohnii]
MDEIIASYIIEDNSKVELIYHKTNSGCLLFSFFSLFGMAGIILFFLPKSFVLALLGIFITVVGLIILVPLFLIVMSVLKKGRTLMTIENNRIHNDKHDILLSEVTEISYGWKFLAFKSIILTTKNKKTFKLPTYNLVPDRVLEKFVDTYVIPNVDPNVFHDRGILDHHYTEQAEKISEKM